jgi:hypothetical protein
MFRALLREPLSIFALVGALLFGVYVYLDERASPPVTLTAETRASLIGAFEQLAGREATAGGHSPHRARLHRRRTAVSRGGGAGPAP